jgi:regulator of sirC expression with transglutaminase-like and TPR domain
VQTFDDWVRGAQRDLDAPGAPRLVEVGCAILARDAYPDLALADVLVGLDEIARGIAREGLDRAPAEETSRALGHHLHVVHGFRGNVDDYGDPRNSHLNDVLDRRLGIPITLAVVLLGVARRIGVAAHGVAFPGHFLVRFERPSPRGGPVVVDPFFTTSAEGAPHEPGRALESGELARLLRRHAGDDARLSPRHLEPATPRAILVRILQNLKGAYAARGDLSRALVAAARVTTLIPREPWAIRDRGLLQAQLGVRGGARADLERYLALAPRAADATSIRQVIARLESVAATAN